MNLAEFIIKVESFNANVNIPLIRQAYEFSEKAHKGQKRESGSPFIEHCLEVGLILAGMHLDSPTIAAGMIHDVVEDTDFSMDQIKQEFGDEIALLVDGITKISGLKFRSREEEQVENFRKLLLSMAKDIRVIIIKLADRLHNMRTLEYLKSDKRIRIAEETYNVYAPLAHRFGMAAIKWELEDLAFKYLNPDAYQEIAVKVQEKKLEREQYIQAVVKPLQTELVKANIQGEIAGRAKHFDSIYRKMVKRNKPFEEIYDLFAIRVIVNTVHECYHTLGIIHSLWTPVQDRFHDYIALPKSNMYQSLHTTVIGPHGQMVEIQIRTQAMHRTAEFGIAAHWLYKEGRMKADESDRQMAWLREVLEWQKDMTNPAEFLEYLKIDLFHDDIFVFTPRGEIKQLPRGATPLDFAFAVHTDVGYHCTGARMNGKICSLSTPLNSGDEVEIITSAHQSPHADWLKIVKTARAKNKIRYWLKQQGYEKQVSLGKELFEKELKRNHIHIPPEPELNDIAMGMSFTSGEAMFAALGEGVISINQIVHKLRPEKQKPAPLAVLTRVAEKIRGAPRGIRVQGLGDLLFRFAQCCQPVPGEPIIGFITRGRGVSIHRVDCSNALQISTDSDRKVLVDWDVDKSQSFTVRLSVLVEDRKNILADITTVISETEANVRAAEIKGGSAGTAGSFMIEVRNLAHLNRVVNQIKKVKGVVLVERAKGAEQDWDEERKRTG